MKAGNLTAKEAVDGLENLEYKGMLYDFYGELLTQHQKKIYEDAILNDLSLSEIADEQGISRQECMTWSGGATRSWLVTRTSSIWWKSFQGSGRISGRLTGLQIMSRLNDCQMKL